MSAALLLQSLPGKQLEPLADIVKLNPASPPPLFSPSLPLPVFVPLFHPLIVGQIGLTADDTEAVAARAEKEEFEPPTI